MSLSRIKTWGAEVLNYADLNAEFDNILNNSTSLITPLTATLNANSNVISNAIHTHSVVTFDASDATPSVAAGTVFKTANASATTITMFDGGSAGQIIWVLINDNNTTIDFTGTNLEGNNGANWSPVSGDHLSAVFISPSWYCTVSNNTTAQVESGTWTPDLGGTATYTSQLGYFEKVGKLVHVTCALSVNLIGTGNTSGLVSGCLPYPVKANTVFTAPVSFNDLSANMINVVVHAIPSGSVSFRSLAAAGAGLVTQAIIGDGTDIWFTGSYITD
jgi:hypothetical protein